MGTEKGALPQAFGGLDASLPSRIAQEALSGADGGELFLESYFSESYAWEDGALKSAGCASHGGFGLRTVAGERFAFSHGDDFSEESMRKAAAFVRELGRYGGGASGRADKAPLYARPREPLYPDAYPLAGIPASERIELLRRAEEYVRSLDKRVVRTSLSLAAEIQSVAIFTREGVETDVRPLLRFNIRVIAEENGRREQGSYGYGGRGRYADFCGEPEWRQAADEALRKALVNLAAEDAPGGEMQVVLGSGWPGVLLHEAIGHGLEGDFNRKKSSAFSELMGKRIAAKGVYVLDDGALPGRRGSLTIDDEGTPTGPTVLIEDGTLASYIYDKMNARLMGVRPTGNGRRESHAHPPLPRMTNTYMKGGEYAPEEIVASIKDGIYAPDFGGGQVDITSGKFVFAASEAYRVKNGKIVCPVRGATLIGNGPDVLTRIAMIGDDAALDKGIGTCGKAGQGVPVGVGQPTIRVDGLTVGGAG
jgi:TldD protein